MTKTSRKTKPKSKQRKMSPLREAVIGCAVHVVEAASFLYPPEIWDLPDDHEITVPVKLPLRYLKTISRA